ncbi:zinc ribbon domain-containing protein, partial [Priestia megaterium]|uniref:zinc ribbon domain-containing protein n=1 Tax=Priestia megaterium TaxID=1404 RepID=UPI0035B5BFA8
LMSRYSDHWDATLRINTARMFGYQFMLMDKAPEGARKADLWIQVERDKIGKLTPHSARSRFQCVECGFKENADLVGAINIKARGHRVLACGETGLPVSTKQEPVRNREGVAPNAT